MGWFVTESVQCQLGTLGVILWPSLTGLSPGYINDEDIYILELRIFPNANLKGVVYTYSRDEVAKRWVLDASN